MSAFTPGMPLSLAELESIQADCLADDLDIDLDRMGLWSVDEARVYFESGGLQAPEPAPPPAPPAPPQPDSRATAAPSELVPTSTATAFPSEPAADRDVPNAPAASAAEDAGALNDLLAEAGLPSSLASGALAGVTCSELAARLNDGRSALLEHLKSLGVCKPPERQKLAKALTLRARGQGVPVMVCFFSGGMTLAQGRDLMRQWQETARRSLGLSEHVLLPHVGEPRMSDTSTTWEDYLRWCEAKVYEEPAHHGRPVVIVAHSHGTVAAFGLARRLGLRVLSLCVVCRRPPHAPLLDEVLGVTSGEAMRTYDASKLLERFHTAWSNPVLEPFVGKPPVEWPPMILELVEVIRRQYTHTPGGSGDVHVAVGGSVPPMPIGAPILAIAAGEEAALGETFEKMQGWKELTSGTCEVVKVDASHMGAMRFGHGGTFELLVKQLKPIVEYRGRAETVSL